MGFTETRALDIYYGADRKPRNANGEIIGFKGEDVKGSHLASEIRFYFTDSGDLGETYAVTIIAKRADGQMRFDLCEKVGIGADAYYKVEFNNWYTEKHGTMVLSVKVYDGEITISEGTLTPSAGTRIIVATTFTFDVKYAPNPSTQVSASELSTLELILLAVESRPRFDDIIKVTDALPSDIGEEEGNYDNRWFLINDGKNGILYYIDGDTAVEANIGTTIAKLLDCDIDSLVSGDILSWNGTKWENSTRLSTAEVTIASNTSRIGVNEGNINSLDVRVGTNETDIANIESGSTIVGKAYADEDGINIKENYVRVGDDPNTPILDENNKLPNSYLQDDVPLINNKNTNGVVYWNGEKLDTNVDFTYNDGVLKSKTIEAYDYVLGSTDELIRAANRFNTVFVVDHSGRVSANGGVVISLLDNSKVALEVVGAPTQNADLINVSSDGEEKFVLDQMGSLEVKTNISLGGDLNIAGDIIQQGSAYETHAEHIYTTKDHMILRDGAVGGLAVGSYAGLVAKLADGTNDSAFVFDGNGMARVGDISYDLGIPNYSNTQALATRQDSPTSNAIAYWNASAYRFDTSSGLVSDLGDNANAGLLINKSAGAGNIANFQFNGANKLEITKDGFITQNGTRFIHNYGISNTSVGKNALSTSTTGSYNSSFGEFALSSNTSGSYNDAFGFATLFGNLSGGYNVAFGSNAGRYIADGSTPRTTGNYGLYLGRSSRASADGTTNEIVIGYNAIGQGSNSVVLGNTDITKTILRGNVGINQASPTSQLHIVSSAADKVGLIVASANSPTVNLTEWFVGSVKTLVIDENGYINRVAESDLLITANGASFNLGVDNDVILDSDIAKIQLNGAGVDIEGDLTIDAKLYDSNASSGTEGQILEVHSDGKPRWKTKSAYSGPTETLLGSRATNGTLSVTDIDTYDELILDLGDATNGFGNNRSIFKVQSSTDYLYNVNTFTTEDSKIVSVVLERDSAGTTLTATFYNQSSTGLTLEVYGRNY